MNQNKLSADPTAMVLGIIALVVSFAGCCCGVFAVIPIVMSIIGLVMSNKSIREFRQNQNAYSPQSMNNVNTAKIINIIALIMSSCITLFYIAYFVFYGAFLSTAIMEGYKQQQNYEDNYEDYESEKDTIGTWEDDTYIIEKELDSIDIDVIEDEQLELKKTFIEGGSI